MDFRGFDSSRILNLRGGIPRPKENFLEVLSQRMDNLNREIGHTGYPRRGDDRFEKLQHKAARC